MIKTKVSTKDSCEVHHWVFYERKSSQISYGVLEYRLLRIEIYLILSVSIFATSDKKKRRGELQTKDTLWVIQKFFKFWGTLNFRIKSVPQFSPDCSFYLWKNIFLTTEKYGDWLICNMHIYYAHYEGLNDIMHFKAL